MSITGIPELKQAYRQMGARTFVLSMAAILAYAGVGLWLMMSATWPGTCDHRGRRIEGLVKELYCSPDLLSGGLPEIALFLWLWSMPVGVAGFILFTTVRKRRAGRISAE